MRAWWVTSVDLGGVYVRADTRGAAKRYHPAYGVNDTSTGITGLLTKRAAWLDGPGPARELRAVYRPCDHMDDGTWDDCGCPICWEGEYVDQAATIAANGGGDA